jgi:biopolymer transport protein ExbB
MIRGLWKAITNAYSTLIMARDSKDPLVRTVWHGLNHVHSSVEGALQVASGVEIQRAGRFMSVMDTTITLAPLLGSSGRSSVSWALLISWETPI